MFRRSFMKNAMLGIFTLPALFFGYMVKNAASSISVPDKEGDNVAAGPYPVNPLKTALKNYKHKGDFTVMTIGTGCPDTIVGRSGPSTLVQYKGNYFLVDIGAGTTFRIVESGISLGSIKNIFITHMHTDHTDGYIKFMIESWTQGRRDTNIFGIKGIKAFLFLHPIFHCSSSAVVAMGDYGEVGNSIIPVESVFNTHLKGT